MPHTDPHTDPRIDAYIAQAPDFARPVLEHLRAQVRQACPEAEETIKWSRPHWTLDGRLLAGMSAFKAHCSFGFWQDKVAGAAGADERAMGQFGRITALADLPPAAELRRLIQKAAQLGREGTAPARAPKPPRPALQAPADLLAGLAGNAAARHTFEAFPPGKQRDYIEWIVEAKREDTRAKRLSQALEWLAEGKARHWKYERC
ncbi:MAG: YdeI/OmpD-associated family protein [Burkholderiaceae bacterium]